MANYKWKDSDVITFLESYKDNPCLWNTKMPEYKDKSKRLAALRNMLLKLDKPGLTIEGVKLKIKNIRTTYNVERQKIMKSTHSGVGTQDVYKPRLFWFQHANSFLQGIAETRDSVSNFETHTSSVHHRDDGSSNYEAISKDPGSGPRSSFSERRRRKKSETIKNVQKAISDLAKLNETVKEDDEFDLFGRAVAVQLKKMPLACALELQQEIQTIVNRYRITLCHNLDHNAVNSPVASPNSTMIPTSSPTDVGDDSRYTNDANSYEYVVPDDQYNSEPSTSNYYDNSFISQDDEAADEKKQSWAETENAIDSIIERTKRPLNFPNAPIIIPRFKKRKM